MSHWKERDSSPFDFLETPPPSAQCSMNDHQHLDDVHPRLLSRNADIGHEVNLSHKYQGSSRRSWSGSDHCVWGGCNGGVGTTPSLPLRPSSTSKGDYISREAVSAPRSPHLNLSTISAYPAHASASTPDTLEMSRASLPDVFPRKAFYDGPSMHDSIPALPTQLNSAAAPSLPHTPATAQSVMIPQWSGFRDLSTLCGARDTAESKTKMKNKANQSMIRGTRMQKTKANGLPSTAAVHSASALQRKVEVCSSPNDASQRPAAAHITLYAPGASALGDATNTSSKPKARRSATLKPRDRPAPPSHDNVEWTYNVNIPSITNLTRSSGNRSTRHPHASTRGKGCKVLGPAADVAFPAPSTTSTGNATHELPPPSRMRGLLEEIVNSTDRRSHGEGDASVDEVSPQSTNLRACGEKLTCTIASPLILQQPMEGVGVRSADPFEAAVRAAGDPLALRHTIDYLISKVHRLEKDNQRLWWQTHSWDPHREIERRELHPTRRQPRPSQATARSADGTSPTCPTQVRPQRSGCGEGSDAAVHDRTFLLSPPHNGLVSHPSAALNKPIVYPIEPTRIAMRLTAPRAEAGVQCSPAKGGATAAFLWTQPPALVSTPTTVEASNDTADTQQHVFPTHRMEADEHFGLVTPPTFAPLSLANMRHQAPHRQGQGTKGEDNTNILAATPILPMGFTAQSLDSAHLAGTIATHSEPVRPVSAQQQPHQILSARSHCAHTTETIQANECSGSYARPLTHNKQVQTARIRSPPTHETGRERGGITRETSMASATDRISSALSAERTALIELHTSASYTQETVRRLQTYTNSLEATRQQLQQRLSGMLSKPCSPSALALSDMQPSPNRSLSLSQPPLSSPGTGTHSLPRPFFNSEYADPEIDATLHDIDEIAAVETVIVVKEDGAGTVTKRMLGPTTTPTISFATHTLSCSTPRPATAVDESAVFRRQRHSPLHRGPTNSSLCPALHSQNTYTPEKEPRACRINFSLNSDSSTLYYEPVVDLSKPARCLSAKSSNPSDPIIYSPGILPPTFPLSTSMSTGPPGTDRFAVPPIAAAEGDTHQLSLPSRSPKTGAGTAPLLSSSGITMKTRRSLDSPRFAVREATELLSAQHLRALSQSSSHRSRSDSGQKVLENQESLSTPDASPPAVPQDSMRQSTSQSSNSIVLSSTTTEFAAATALDNDSDVKGKRSMTRAFLDEEEEAAAVAVAERSSAAVQLSALEADDMPPDGADSFHFNEATLEELPSLQHQQPVSQQLMSPSPPPEALTGNTAHQKPEGNVGLSLNYIEATQLSLGIDSTTPRRSLAPPQYHSPIASSRTVSTPKSDDPSSPAGSTLSLSLYSFPSMLSERNVYNACDDDERTPVLKVVLSRR